MALNNYRMMKVPQVVSLQAPTGSGKTIIMSALIEDIFFGSDQFTEQQEKKFHEMNDQYRKYIASKPEKCRKQYSDIVADGDEMPGMC